MRQAGISLVATPLAKIRELAASPQNVLCSDPLPPATQATVSLETFTLYSLGSLALHTTNLNQPISIQKVGCTVTSDVETRVIFQASRKGVKLSETVRN